MSIGSLRIWFSKLWCHTTIVFYQLLNKSLSPLKFFVSYKMLQDHLKLLFGFVRDRGGSNNNPYSEQFKITFVETNNCSNLDLPEGNIIEFYTEKR